MTMKKKYITVLLLLLGTIASAQQMNQLYHVHSACDNDSIDPMVDAIISEVTVTGITGTQRMKDAPSPFTVISPKELHSASGANIVDIIARQPGLSQISTGAGISKPIIRGLGYNRVVVVEQGIRQEGQQWGDEHGLEVDAEGVHSVEILKGPASLMYGSDAIAGVMILHPEGVLQSGLMQVKAGGGFQSNNGLYDYNIGFAGNMNGFVWNGHFADKSAHCYTNATDGYVPGSWFSERDWQAMLGINKGWGHSWLRFSTVNFTPGISEGERDELTGELVWEDGNSSKSHSRQLPSQKVQHTKVVSDNALYVNNMTLKAIFGYQQNYRREFEEDFDEAELAMRLHTLNYDVKTMYSMPANLKISAGVGGMWQENANEGEEFLIPDYNLFDFGVFATASKEFGKWHLSGGARFDVRHLQTEHLEEEGENVFASLDKNFTGVTGSIGSVWNASEKLNIRLNVSRGFRAPTVSELSSNGVHEGSIQYELGNAELNPEKSTQIDLGFDYTSHMLNIQASLFANRISDYIFLQRLNYLTEGYRTYQYRQGDAQLAGGEFMLDVHLLQPLHIANAFSYVRGIQLHQPDESHNLPMMPAPKWTCDVRYEFGDFANNHLRRTNVAFASEYNFRQDKFYALDDTETETPGYAVFNLSASTDLHIFGHNCFEISIGCQNVFDKVYQSHLSRLKYADENVVTGRQGISAMGRNFYVKVNIPIDIKI